MDPVVSCETLLGLLSALSAASFPVKRGLGTRLLLQIPTPTISPYEYNRCSSLYQHF